MPVTRLQFGERHPARRPCGIHQDVDPSNFLLGFFDHAKRRGGVSQGKGGVAFSVLGGAVQPRAAADAPQAAHP